MTNPQFGWRYHPGQRRNRQGVVWYDCCGVDGPIQGCITCEQHYFYEPARTTMYRGIVHTPRPDGSLRYKAVVLDCEMVGTNVGLTEVVIVSMVDYVTKRVLLDTFVQPKHRVSNWATQCHGVTAAILNNARRAGKVLSGWEAARHEIWKFIDSDTVIIGHAVKNDLDVLGMVHHKIVDSAILCNMISGGHKQWGLDGLVKEFLNVPFRNNSGGIHNCLEDVMATREVSISEGQIKRSTN